MEKNNLVDIKELAAVLHVPISWIYERTSRGQEGIPHIKMGKYVRFNVEEVLAFFKSKANWTCPKIVDTNKIVV